jgi:hypothetical protein
VKVRERPAIQNAARGSCGGIEGIVDTRFFVRDGMVEVAMTCVYSVRDHKNIWVEKIHPTRRLRKRRTLAEFQGWRMSSHAVAFNQINECILIVWLDVFQGDKQIVKFDK